MRNQNISLLRGSHEPWIKFQYKNKICQKKKTGPVHIRCTGPVIVLLLSLPYLIFSIEVQHFAACIGNINRHYNILSCRLQFGTCSNSSKMSLTTKVADFAKTISWSF